MGRMTYAEVAAKPADVLALTRLTVDECQQLVAPFETAFQVHMAAWTLEGTRRQNRRYTPYPNSPLPTPEDRLLFILSYLKHTVTHAYHGHLFALPQWKVNQWVHTLFPVLRATLRATGDAPSRTHAALAERLDTVLVTGHGADAGPPPEDKTAPLFATTPPNAPSRAPRTRLNKPAMTAGRPRTIPAKTRS